MSPSCRVFAYVIGLTATLHASANDAPGRLSIPDVTGAAKRLITIDDMASIRTVDSLSVAPDGRRFAIFVRQGDVAANAYRTGWFVGSVGGENLEFIGDGGTVEPQLESNGFALGTMVGRQGQWSPDGEWIAYTLQANGEVQLWRSRADGSTQEQLTRTAADVHEFAWSAQGTTLYFRMGKARATLTAEDERGERNGYRYDSDFYDINDFMKERLTRPVEVDPETYVVTVDDRRVRPASGHERELFRQALLREAGGAETAEGFYDDAAIAPIKRADGASVWLERLGRFSQVLRVAVSLPSKGQARVACMADMCSGFIKRVWWSRGGVSVLFWRLEGINNRDHAFYSWAPGSNRVTTLFRMPDESFQQCSYAAGDHLLCVRETKTVPSHVVALDVRKRTVHVVGDVNPELRNMRLGRIERFEWDTPRFEWNAPGGALAELYPSRAYGYIFYPPDFDPARRYPVIVEPYVASGFFSFGSEHALHVYAACGFVVLNLEFPAPTDAMARMGAAVVKELYSRELRYPHLSMLAASTLAGLDAAIARGFIDSARIGIGGVSHGSFIPLYMLQKYDRLAAVSISGPGWSPSQYYWGTRRGRDAVRALYGKVGLDDWLPKPEGRGREFWSDIDIADHVDAIEAPVLIQAADQEAQGLVRLIRHLADAHKPYDAYIFRHETHLKWQPAHLRAITQRNLDWFRFWLQGYEEPSSSEASEYAGWRALREQRMPSRSVEHTE